MNSSIAKICGIFGIVLGGAGVAAAQGGWAWDWICIHPENQTPYSDDFGINTIANDLFLATVGGSGTVTYGGQGGPCFSPAFTAEVRGRVGFSYGFVGSSHSDIDDNMRLTMGMPISPAATWSYANLVRQAPGAQPTRSLFGANPFILFFSGASDRYIYAETVNDGVNMRLIVDVVGDAARLEWRLQNQTPDPLGLGLWFGQWVVFLDNFGEIHEAGFVWTPGRRPLRINERFIRNLDIANFPDVVNFGINREHAFGLQVLNGTPREEFNRAYGADITPVDEFVIGDQFFLLGSARSNASNFPDFIFERDGQGDLEFQDGDGFTGGGPGFFGREPAYIQKWQPSTVGAGGERRIVGWYRSTYATSDYGAPYAVVLDPPNVIAPDPADPHQFENSPFHIRVYVDNIRGFTAADREIPLNDVRITLLLPQGLHVAGNPAQRQITRTIARVEPKEVRFIDFQVEAEEFAFGELTYQVRVSPSPGPEKLIPGTIMIGTTPRLLVREGANLVAAPWFFADRTWETVLQNLGVINVDYQVFTWDPQQNGYIIQTHPQRGHGSWIVSDVDAGFVPLASEPGDPNSSPQIPPDIDTGAPLIQIRHGWNLIGNPYPYSIPLGQIVGVSGANPTQAFTFTQLVQQGVISSSLATWDATTQSYRFIDGAQARLMPNQGYWIFVFTLEPFTLSFPPVFEAFVPFRSVEPTWTQTDRQWRLQLVARGNRTMDDANFIGQASSAANEVQTRVYEPPMAPVRGAVSLYVDTTVDGKPTRLAKALTAKTGRQEWTVMVETRDAGQVTLNWPNMGSVPKNVQFRLLDVATGETRNMRRVSGYSFEADERSTREFRIQVEPGVASRPVIGNVIVSGDGRSAGNGSMTINYTLAGEALTTVRILNNRGQEIYTATRGRSEGTGQHSVVWHLRDSANRAVAPGSYRVEIIAESEGGERVRHIVPITVVR
jgi:hypothetical protein